MSNWVIVAIPDKEDIVWKISSEQIPHMTILNLGEQDPNAQAAKIISYLEHATETMLHRFRMSVDHRGTLGPQNADVLFFDKSYCEKQVKDFRAALLQNPDILELFNGADQFPEWVPHLTLGFPETPAHPDTRDYIEIYSVGFGKVALWLDNFSGPEVELKSREGCDLLMSELSSSSLYSAISAVEEVDPKDALQFGRLGMQWGIRRPRGADGRVKETSPVASPDKSVLKTQKRIAKAHGSLHGISNEDLKKLNERINLENNYRTAIASKQSADKTKFDKTHDKIKKGLNLGKTANEAIKFYNSDAGQLLRAVVGQDSHRGKHNKLNQPVKTLLEAANASNSGGGKRKKK